MLLLFFFKNDKGRKEENQTFRKVFRTRVIKTEKKKAYKYHHC